MKIYFIRHGEAAGDPFAEPAPPAAGFLTPPGERQARALGRALAAEAITRVWCSPYGRALRTACLAFPGVLPRVLGFLKEWQPNRSLRGADRTRWEDINRAAAEWHAEETWQTPLGEGCLELVARVGPPFLAALAELGARARHGGFVLEGGAAGVRLAVVAHGGSLAALLGFLLRIPPFPVAAFSFAHCGLSVLHFHQVKDVWYPQLVIPPPYGPGEPPDEEI